MSRSRAPRTPTCCAASASRSRPARSADWSGESGAGKSMLGRAVLGLLPANAIIAAGTIAFEGRDLLGMREAERRSLLGRRIALIPQDPMTSLNPVKRVGAQIGSLLRHHLGLSKRGALARASRTSGRGRDPRTGAGASTLSARNLRRHAAARADRDGVCLRSAPGDRGRADHRARRHRAAPGAAAGRAAAAAPRRGRAVRHP